MKSSNIHAIIASTSLVLAIGAPLQAQNLTTSATAQLEAQVLFNTQYVTDYAGERAAEMVVALQDAGYQVTDMSRTFLGRTKITVQNEIHVREIVLGRRTGEVKRDAIIEPDTQQPSERSSNDRPSTNNRSQTSVGTSVNSDAGSTGLSAGSSAKVSVSIGLGN